MSKSNYDQVDPKLDLVLERVVEAPRALIWKAWTQPEHLKKWLAPLPWTTVECEVDLRPGGIFRFVMRSPEGKDFPNVCCYLEIVENEKLVWTDALLPGYRPAVKGFFTAILTFEEYGGGTRYTARAIHKDEADRQTHEDMGFYAGWSQCLDQLLALIPQIK
jgi:uncharacterized protein YndB with AHSA1/START domain